MILFTETQVARFVFYRRRYYITGLTLMTVALLVPRGMGIGFITGFMLVSLGSYSVAFRNWRTEPGIWMLAGFLSLVLTPCWLYFECLLWQRLFTPLVGNKQNAVLTWDAFRFTTDALFSLLVFGKTVRLCVSVAFQNWHLTKNTVPATAAGYGRKK